MEARQQHQQQQQQHQMFGSAEPQRLLKVKVRVCGRFLLRPDEDFGPEKADELVRRVAKDGAKVRTNLNLYNTDLRLGDNGIFASMPLERIKYQRIAACISPRQQQQRTLALCTKDYEQKCITIVKFKDAAALAEASRLIDRQRRLVAEEVNYLPDTPLLPSKTSNWALETAPQTPTDHRQYLQPQQQPSPLPQQQHRRDIVAEPSPTARHEARVTVTRARASRHSSSAVDDVFVMDEQPLRQQQQQHQQQQHQQQRQQRRQEIDSVIVSYDDVAAGPGTYAVFESSNGPPTLLNERVAGDDRIVSSQSSGATRPATLRVHTDEVDGQLLQQRAQVTYVTTGVNGQRGSSLQQHHQQQQQLVRLVPVRRRHHQQQQQFALHHYQANGNHGSVGRGYYLVTK